MSDSISGDQAAEGWAIARNVTCVVCPGCAFTFANDHTDSDGGGYSCPVCAEVALEAERDAALEALGRAREDTPGRAKRSRAREANRARVADLLADREHLREALAYIAAPDDLLDANEGAFNIHAARRMQARARAALADREEPA